jgi:mannose/fructose/N-acetylgalactosamine-specific phosphotransferase system component IIB
MKSKTLKSITFLLLLLVASPQLFAHALWIETKATGTKGKAQEISVFFGEFSDNDITPSAKWFSDLKDFSLVVISPSKKEIKLTATALENKYQAFFTPDEDGVYTIVMHHTVKDVYGTMKLDYNSSATVTVGNAAKGNEAAANSNIISLFSKDVTSAKQKTKINVNALYEAKIAKSQKMKVIAPNGWEKELWSNENGEISFTPIWPGNYMVEFAYTEKAPGEHNGKKYDEIWKMATYLITVK